MDTRPADPEARRPRGASPWADLAALSAPDLSGLTEDALVCPVPGAGLDRALAGLAPSDRFAADAARVRAREGQTALLPGPEGGPPGASPVLGLEGRKAPGRRSLAAAVAALAEGSPRVGRALPPLARHGWLPARHRLGRCLTGPDRDRRGPRRLLVAADPARAERKAKARPRALTDASAGDPGPAERRADIRGLSARRGAALKTGAGKAHRAAFPAVHAVGRATSRRQRMIRNSRRLPDRPLVAVVGKGVCFSRGGPDIRPGPATDLGTTDGAGRPTRSGRPGSPWPPVPTGASSPSCPRPTP